MLDRVDRFKTHISDSFSSVSEHRKCMMIKSSAAERQSGDSCDGSAPTDLTYIEVTDSAGVNLSSAAWSIAAATKRRSESTDSDDQTNKSLALGKQRPGQRSRGLSDSLPLAGGDDDGSGITRPLDRCDADVAVCVMAAGASQMTTTRGEFHHTGTRFSGVVVDTSGQESGAGSEEEDHSERFQRSPHCVVTEYDPMSTIRRQEDTEKVSTKSSLR